MKSTKGRWSRVAIASLAGLTLIGTLTACGKDVNGSSDEAKCVYNNETGALDGDVMMPGSERRNDVDNEYTVVSIPTSNRFWNISETDSRDAAAPSIITARDASYKETKTAIEVGFRFNASLACKWFDQHGRRDTNGTNDMLFNVKGDPNTPWQQWLNRVFTSMMERVNQDLVRQRSWEYLEFNFPVNADKNGVVPEGQEPAPQTLRQMEVDFGLAMSARLKADLGEDYFCGINYDVGGKCTPLLVKISSVKLIDQQPVEDRKALIAQAEANAIAVEQAELTRTGTQAAVDARKAQAEKDRQINAINAQAEIDKANEAKRVKDAQRASDEAAAAQEVAACLQLAQAGLAVDCPELLNVLADKGLRLPNAGVSLTPAG